MRRGTEVFDTLRGRTHSRHSSPDLAWGMADQLNGEPMNEQRDAEIVRRYEAGETSTELGAEYGLSPQRIRQILQEREVETRNPTRSPLPRAEIVEYAKDHTIRETAEHFGCSPSSVHRALKAAEG